ncbi:hypothetical protein OE09_0886 [Flavobacteriaceae bacterium MAR_2010_72]|nr:hypothetical protein OE09_0886 [Flavobacteriaceae bacterium MAR_2010_72]
MIKFFRHKRKSLLMENNTVCHSALDAESTLKLIGIPARVYLERRRKTGMTEYFKI